MLYKRKIISKLILISFIFILLFNGSACKSDIPPLNKIKVHSDFSVNFLDVGQGDCIFIRLPDRKNMLIDCGINDYYGENIKYIKSLLKAYNVSKIDYFVLTHPDVDHIGNAYDIINTISIGKMYLPYIHKAIMQNFNEFLNVLNLIEQKQIDYEISDITKSIVGNNYFFAFLSPLELTNSKSSYNTILQNQIPTDKDINNLSPIIYFECFSQRFIFTGDAGIDQERLVINNYQAGVYDLYHKNTGISVNLENIEYLKVSHHGSVDASSYNFLNLLNPSNAIISVGNENFYGHPASETLLRLSETCPSHNLFRTDMLGTITVYRENGVIKITSSKEK